MGSRTPVTILGGFLGSGKTTLLNRILANQQGRKIGVLVNDFGDINIDARLVEKADEHSMRLANGCICCSIKEDLVSTLQEMVRGEDPPEHVLIEASGVSDPSAIAVSVDLYSFAYVHSSVVLVDADALWSREGEMRAYIEAQLSECDLAVLNKADLLGDDLQRAQVESVVKNLAPSARIMFAAHADIPLELIFDAPPSRIERTPAGVPDHGHTFESFSFVEERPLFAPLVKAVVEDLPVGIYRAKGFLHLSDGRARRWVLQVVGRRSSLAPGEPWGDEPPRTELVFIGRRGELDAERVRENLQGCVHQPSSPWKSAVGLLVTVGAALALSWFLGS